MQRIDQGKVAGRIARMWEDATAGNVNRIRAGLHGPIANCNRIFELITFLAPRIERVIEIRGIGLQLHMKRFACLFFDIANDLQDKLGAAFQLSTVLVRAVVDSRAEKLRDQVAVSTM